MPGRLTFVERLSALRRRGEEFSDMILRLAKIEASKPGRK
jgi:hypothetical protein